MFRILLAELQFELGKISEAKQIAEALSTGVGRDEPIVKARAHRVLVRCAFHAGELERSRRHLENARQICQGAKDDGELAKLELTRFSLLLGVDH